MEQFWFTISYQHSGYALRSHIIREVWAEDYEQAGIKIWNNLQDKIVGVGKEDFLDELCGDSGVFYGDNGLSIQTVHPLDVIII